MKPLQRCWITRAGHWAWLSLWPSSWCWSSVVLGSNQESRAQPVVLRQERRAAPRDPPVMHSGMGLGWTCLGSHHLPRVRAWWRRTSVVFMLGLELSLEPVLPETWAETRPSVLWRRLHLRSALPSGWTPDCHKASARIGFGRAGIFVPGVYQLSAQQ